VERHGVDGAPLRDGLNRHLSSGYAYEIVGEDANGASLAYRGYSLKKGDRKVSIQVWIEEIGGQIQMDPTGEHIVDSMREAP
jgi:hypothetical protein